MLLNRTLLGLSFAMVVAGVGCGGEDPLTQTWNNDTCFDSSTKPEGVKSCSTALSFHEDLTFTLKSELLSEPATVSNPGCTTTRVVEGQTWSTDGTIFTLSGLGKATMSRSGCVNEKDNLDAVTANDIAVPPGSSEYVINDRSLTITQGPLKGAYTD